MKVLVFTAMYPTAENPAFGSFIRTQVHCLEKHGVDVEVLVLDGSPRKLIYPKGILQLRRRLARGDIDIVHAHYSFVGMVARTQWRTPVVVTYHGSDLLGSLEPDGSQTRSNFITVPAGKALARWVDACIVQSRQMADLIPAANVQIIPHEIDLETFRPTERSEARAALGLDQSKRYVLFAAHPQNGAKNFPLAQAVVERLAERDLSVELLVVYKEPQDRLALYMSAADALVFPSVTEGSPNIVKQAMACNLPIVASDVGDVREVISGTPGCYVSDLTVDAFVGYLTKTLAQPYRTDGRTRVDHLTCAVIGRRVINLYEDVLARRRVRHGQVSHETSPLKSSEGGE